MKRFHKVLSLSACLAMAGEIALAQPTLIASDPNRTVQDIAFGVYSQDTNSGVIAAWLDPATNEATVDFHRFGLTSTWQSERIAAISDVGTSPTNSTAPAIRVIAGDYSGDGRTDVSVMYNSFLTTTSLLHFQRGVSGFVSGDTSMQHVLSEAGAYSATFWQDIALGDPVNDGVPTLVAHSIDLFRTATGSANSVPSLGYGAQDIYFLRRADTVTPFGSGSSVSDKEIARATTEEGPIAIGDITGDGIDELIWSESLWNRSPGWGHHFTLYAGSNDQGAGSFIAGDTSTYYDEQPSQMYGNGLPKIGIMRDEFLYASSFGQFGITAVLAGQDITRDGIPDLIVARADTFFGDQYGESQTGGATNDTDNLGVLQILQVGTAGALNTFVNLSFDNEDFGTYIWTKLASGDVNGDGEIDLIAVAENTSTGDWHLFKYEWDQGGFIAGNGAASNSWPTNDSFVPPSTILNSATRVDLITPVSGASITAMSVGNADGDADLEIVYALSTGEVYVLDLAGDLETVPVELSSIQLD